MNKLPPSIFNDVIGPVMRGSSSSHVAAASRIGALVRQSLGGDVARVLVDFDVNGSLAETHDGHGTDMGFVSGIMGIDMTDPAMLDAERLAKEAGIHVEFRVIDYDNGALHPNHFRIAATGKNGTSRCWEALSVGGGMIEMIKFDGFDVHIEGDFYEFLITLVTADTAYSVDELLDAVKKICPSPDFIDLKHMPGKALIALKFAAKPDFLATEALRTFPDVMSVVCLEPILPTHGSASCTVPFRTPAQLEIIAKGELLQLWEFAARYEAARGNTTQDDVFEKMRAIVAIMEKGVAEGLRGTEYKDRILGPQAFRIDESHKQGKLVPCDMLNTTIKFITSLMEVKSSMGVIVAAPTAGACGCLPGTILSVGKTLCLPQDEIVKGMLAAGIVGVFIAELATFAAEVAGCQVECGAGSGMAAAGVVQMMGGSVQQCLDAASIALQNITGLACDPVGNRVEVPCLGKNIMGGVNALASANMALAGYDKVIPLDQTITAMYDIGTKLPKELRCTFGGLGKTQASLEIGVSLRESKKYL